MLRIIGKLVIIFLGAAIGGIIGLIAGAAFLESGRVACQTESCADIIVHGFAPAGALFGTLLAMGKIFAMREGRA